MFVLPDGGARRRQARCPDLEGDVEADASCAACSKTFKAAHVDSPDAQFLRGEVIEVGSDRPFVIYGDGDPIGNTPATVRVERRCLRVIAPG